MINFMKKFENVNLSKLGHDKNNKNAQFFENFS